MIRVHHVRTPLTPGDVEALAAGDRVCLDGLLLTAREEAHRRILEDAASGAGPPFSLEGAVLYYVGPSPMTPERPVGAAGPSSAARMDPYADALHALGVRATIGKGSRSPGALGSLVRRRAVYLGATGGAGALLSTHIRGVRLAGYAELGAEAVYELHVREFPLVVLADAFGGTLHAAPDLAAALG